MPEIISCDWGTSVLRLSLVDTDTQRVLANTACAQGISETYKLWQQQTDGEEQRVAFYLSVVNQQIEKLKKLVGGNLQNIPVIMSGMASSSIGMAELLYKELPIFTNGNDLIVKKMKGTKEFRHPVTLISGVRTNDDVMRGEETQLIGCNIDFNKEQILIFPGTHSKHVFVKQNKVVDFRTYMTGEFFALLTTHSILSSGIKASESDLSDNFLKSFGAGVVASMQSNMLHNSFLARTNQLFERYTKEENYHYLSGLLIGTELREITNQNMPVTLVASKFMTTYYTSALQKLNVLDINAIDADKATARGHCKIFNEKR